MVFKEEMLLYQYIYEKVFALLSHLTFLLHEIKYKFPITKPTEDNYYGIASGTWK